MSHDERDDIHDQQEYEHPQREVDYVETEQREVAERQGDRRPERDTAGRGEEVSRGDREAGYHATEAIE